MLKYRAHRDFSSRVSQNGIQFNPTSTLTDDNHAVQALKSLAESPVMLGNGLKVLRNVIVQERQEKSVLGALDQI